MQALSRQVKAGNLDVIRNYVESGGDIHFKHDYALRHAVKHGHFDLVKYLLSRGADLHAVKDEPYRWSAKYGRLEILQYLVSQGLDLKPYGKEALKWAAHNGHSDIVKYLTEQGIEFDWYWLCQVGSLTGIKYLLSYRNDLHKINYYINVAVNFGYLPIVKFLVENFRSEIKSASMPLYNACEKNRLEIVKYLISEFPGTETSNCLAAAARHPNSLELLKYLHELNPSTSDSMVLSFAISSLNLENVKYLYAQGYRCATPLLYAAYRGSLPIFKFFHELETEVVDLNRYLYDCLGHYNGFKKRLDLVKYLVELGAQITPEIRQKAKSWKDPELDAYLA